MNYLLDKSPVIGLNKKECLIYFPYQKLFAKTDFSHLCESQNIDVLRESRLLEFPDTFSPSGMKLVLNLTDGCNMYCKYCWANAEKSASQIMTSEIALQIIKSLLKKGPIERIHFMGGEPTTNMPVIKKVVEFFNWTKSHESPVFYITTNGVVSKRNLQWLIDQRFAFSISWDGISGQNTQRPLINGSGGNIIILESIRKIVKSKLPLRVRMTVSTLNISDLYSSVEELIGMGVRFIHIEPVSPDGRGINFSKKYSIDPKVFVEEFFRVVELAEQAKVWLMNSHLANLFSPKGYYCSALKNKIYNINPSGAISHCYKAIDCNNKVDQEFIVGTYENEIKDININSEKSDKLSKTNVSHFPECDEYYLKYFYSGGCPHRNLSSSKQQNQIDQYMFTMNQLILTRAIMHMYENSMQNKSTALEGYIHFYNCLKPKWGKKKQIEPQLQWTNNELSSSASIQFIKIPTGFDYPVSDIDACDICI